ncbi:hypothetical protein [Streptomyces sp. CC53]|uniref:hypothetical protein n=1 Tax=Streptomyces sp. CC53 TaxID=1906740 RepID=UPI00115FB5FC|nr:hypothetical protein [Streptomyces sp. CC53]
MRTIIIANTGWRRRPRPEARSEHGDRYLFLELRTQQDALKVRGLSVYDIVWVEPAPPEVVDAVMPCLAFGTRAPRRTFARPPDTNRPAP